MDNRLKMLLLVLLLNGEINGIVIECLYEFDYLYFCHGRVISGHDNMNITDVTGNHIGNRTLADVDSVRLVKQGLIAFPGNINKVFPKATIVDLGKNHITHITNAEIRVIPKLRDLILWGNRLTELDGNLLEGMCYFKFLDVDLNQIKHVGHDFQFPEDGVLFMQQNPCINLTIVSALEVIKVKILLRNKCPPVGVAPEVLPDNFFTYIPDHLRQDLDTENMYEKIEMMEGRLTYLESKLANAIEIRIIGSK